MRIALLRARGLVVLSLASSACAARPPEHVVAGPPSQLVDRGVIAEDTAPKEDLRMHPAGGLHADVPAAVRRARAARGAEAGAGGDGGSLFDTWDDYVSALGFPDYRLDVPRQTQTNALMAATFERLGVALLPRYRYPGARRRRRRSPAPSCHGTRGCSGRCAPGRAGCGTCGASMVMSWPRKLDLPRGRPIKPGDDVDERRSCRTRWARSGHARCRGAR